LAHEEEMPTDLGHAAAIECSLAIAAERGGDLTLRVYALLFARAPEMKKLFWRDANGAIKGEMLMKVFEAIIDFIGARNYAGHLIETEVVTHEGYDVPRDVFATFFGVVAEIVEEACGQDWTTEMGAAWRVLLVDLDHYVKHPADGVAS
jgi:hemoglobin-like flavoprotein